MRHRRQHGRGLIDGVAGLRDRFLFKLHRLSNWTSPLSRSAIDSSKWSVIEAGRVQGKPIVNRISMKEGEWFRAQAKLSCP
ncbi:MAG: hypothetical protein IPH03_13760 [Tetrasphaera sp.]|nr:hypothetical protein [Tetrasphaera sp.]